MKWYGTRAWVYRTLAGRFTLFFYSALVVIIGGNQVCGARWSRIRHGGSFGFALDLIWFDLICEDTVVVDTYELSYSVPAARFVLQHVEAVKIHVSLGLCGTAFT